MVDNSLSKARLHDVCGGNCLKFCRRDERVETLCRNRVLFDSISSYEINDGVEIVNFNLLAGEVLDKLRMHDVAGF